eukprot:scaffold172683_cov23-Tisochrysis_lutea.AAC.1
MLDAHPLRAAATALVAEHAAQLRAARDEASLRVLQTQRGWAELSQQEAVQSADAIEDCVAAHREIRSNEVQRLAAARAGAAGFAAEAAQRWRETSRSLAREQEAWGDPASGSLTTRTERRELLECEDSWRRRPILVENRLLDDHASASLIQQQSGGSAALPLAA